MRTDEPDPRDPRLIDLALRIADAEPVDWESARQTAGDLDETLERLRQIERLAARPGDETEPAGSVEAVFEWGALRALAPLGGGANGEVWRAWDGALAREVALKLRRDGAAGSMARWLEEARRLARVRHPHVLTVHGADVHDGRAGLWSDLIRGRTLEELLHANGPSGSDEAALIGAQLCSALAAVHAAGLVHGDVKTRNVMREGLPGHATGAGRVVLMDFGAAHDASSHDAASALSPLYAAPELLAGGRPSPRSDVYALGVVLYRLVTGEFPLEAASARELGERLARGERVSLRERRPDLAPAFVRTVERALAHDPAERFASAAAFERALDSARAEHTAKPARTGWARPLTYAAAGALFASAVWLGALQGPHWFAPRFEVRPGHPDVVATAVTAAGSDDSRAGFGWSVRALGDLDGDGRSEVGVGCPQSGSGPGEVEIFSANADGTLEPRWVLSGVNEGGQFGYTLAAGGDLDGDGHPDLAVGAIYDSTAAKHSGAVYVYRGGPEFSPRPWAVLRGDQDLQDFGYALSMAGDVNGDGRADLLVGAPTDSRSGSHAGRVFVWFGGPRLAVKPDLDLAVDRAETQFGVSVEGGVDQDGDGVDDVIVGGNMAANDAPLAGRVWIFHGGRRLDGAPDAVLASREAGAQFGAALCAPGDVDGDGEPDLAVGAEYGTGFAEGSGAVFVYRCGPRGSTKPWRVLRGERGGDSFGRTMTGADVNGDGRPDLVVGAYRHDSGRISSGAVYAFFGGARMDDVCDWFTQGQLSYEQLGCGIAALPASAGSPFAVVLAGALQHAEAPRLRGGRLERFEFSRYTLLRPRPGGPLRAGTVRLAWQGAEPARVVSSTDGGAHWTPVAARAGGEAENQLDVPVPAAPATRVRWRIEAADRRWPGAAETGDHAIAR